MKSQNIIGVILIVCGFVLLWLATIYGYVSFSGYAGKATAHSLVAALVIMVLISLTPYRKNVALSLIIGGTWFGSVAFISYDLYEQTTIARKAAQATVELIDAYASGSQIEVGKLDPKDETLEGWLKGYMARVQKIHSDYSDEIDSHGFHEILVPENLIDAERVNQSRMKIGILKESVSYYEELNLKEIEIAETSLAQRKDVVGQGAYRGFMQSNQMRIQVTKDFFHVQRDVIDTVGDILDLSISLSGKLHVQSGQLLFEDQESLDIYSGYVSRLSDLSKLEEAILNKELHRLEGLKEKINAAL